MIIAFLSPMKLCPKLHRSLPLNAIRLSLFFLHVCELPFLQTANSLGTMSHFSCIPPWAGWVHWQSLQIVVALNWQSQVPCHSFPCKSLRTMHHLCVSLYLSQPICFSRLPTCFFSLFPSISLSCSSTWRSVAWVCHEDIYHSRKVPPFKDICSTSDHSRWREGMLNFTSWVCYRGESKGKKYLC